MKNKHLKLLYNPFERIAGFAALAYGIFGLAVSTLLSYWSGWHYHGLLQFGPAPNSALWCFAAEHVVVWLVPATLFYLGSLLLSKSKIRIIDVFGTAAFALLPMIVMNLIYLLPAAKKLLDPAMVANPIEFLSRSEMMLAIEVSVIGVLFLIWALVWLFHALKVSCNLKGWRLALLYCIGVFGGEVICRLIIGLFAASICFTVFYPNSDKKGTGSYFEYKTYDVTDEDLEKYPGVYSSEQIPLKITIIKKNKKLIGQATGQPSFPLEAMAKDKFKYDQAGIILEFNPTDNTMVLIQMGQIFNFIREE